MAKVYLAGGMRSAWQDTVKKAVPEHLYYDPRHKRVSDVNEYVAWDLHYVNQADIVFAYWERTNPSGIGMSAELGYAKAQDKTIIIAVEPGNEHFKDKYIEFVKNLTPLHYERLGDAIKQLRQYR